MRVMIPLRNQDQSDDLIDRLYRDLLQAIAITELMLQRWVEPPNISEQDLSTLVQQILSSLAEFGGMLAKPLFQHLVTRGAFRWLEPTQFASILRSLNQRGVIEQMTDGLLLLSPNGEQFVHDLDFYSVFASAQELAVRFDGRDIGNLSAMYSPKPGDHFLLAGRRWETVEVDSRRAEVTVKPAVGRKRPKFVGSGGEIHPRIRDEMRRVLTGKDEFGYLAATAKAYLDAARNAFWSANQSNSSVLHQGNNSFLWFTWTGTRIQRTLAFLAAMAGFECVDKKIALRVTGTTTEFVTSLSDCVTRLHGDAHGLIDFEITPWRKFDDCLTEDILRQPFLTEWLDLQGAKDHILELSARLSHR